MIKVDLSAADAVWVATALLQREHPERAGFTVREIMQRVEQEELSSRQTMTIYQHANQHCVANRVPSGAKLRMLVETPEGLRRLYREGDPLDPRRTKSRQTPLPEAIPEPYRDLLRWYESLNRNHADPRQSADPLLALVGTWDFGEADRYVNSLREGWE